jgi:Uma2 family endonuclease
LIPISGIGVDGLKPGNGGLQAVHEFVLVECGSDAVGLPRDGVDCNRGSVAGFWRLWYINTYSASQRRESMPTTLTPKKPIKRPKVQANGRVVHEPEWFTIPLGAHTLQGFREWTYSGDFPEMGKITYMGGEILIDMSAERLESHGSVKVEIVSVLGTFNSRKKMGKLYFDRSRVAHLVADLSNEPDAVFVKWSTFKSGKVKLIPTKEEDDFIELQGTPDWIMEIVSPSSVDKDTNLLMLRYHLAGIPEYWLIDARGDNLWFDIFYDTSEGYQAAEVISGWRFSKVYGKKFRLTRAKDPIGGWEYRLAMK